MGVDDEPTLEEDEAIDAAPTSEDPTEKPNDEHDTLKYHLLGPSLTKSGQDGVDQTKVNCPLTFKHYLLRSIFRSRRSSTTPRKDLSTSTMRRLKTRVLHKR